MRQAEKKKQKDKIAIVLMLCFCVIALTSIFTIKSNLHKIRDSQSDVPVSEKTKTSEEAAAQRIPKNAEASDEASARVPAVDSLDARKSRQNEAHGQESTEGTDFAKPVQDDGACVSNEFAMDHLVYSVTLDQYMVHCGVDLEAPADTQVTAIAGGTVTAVYVDDRYGNSVEITQDGGFTAVYSSLSDAAMVEVGDTVTAGQVIGGVGSTALFESLEPAHLHLELLRDGVYVNPMDYISM